MIPAIGLRGHSSDVEGVAFSFDGKRLATSEDETAKVWDAERSRCVDEV